MLLKVWCTEGYPALIFGVMSHNGATFNVVYPAMKAELFTFNAPANEVVLIQVVELIDYILPDVSFKTAILINIKV